MLFSTTASLQAIYLSLPEKWLAYRVEPSRGPFSFSIKKHCNVRNEPYVQRRKLSQSSDSGTTFAFRLSDRPHTSREAVLLESLLALTTPFRASIAHWRPNSRSNPMSLHIWGHGCRAQVVPRYKAQFDVDCLRSSTGSEVPPLILMRSFQMTNLPRALLGPKAGQGTLQWNCGVIRSCGFENTGWQTYPCSL